MPINYQLAKIYEIVCKITDERYIGSTAQPLSSRLAGHRKQLDCSSRQIIERGEYYINLLEDCPCENREQLLKKEREWYDKLDCINKIRPYTSPEEKKEQKKQIGAKRIYTEERRKQAKAYNDANKEQRRIYNDANKDKAKEQRRIYQEANKDKINQRERERYALKKQQLEEII